VKSRRHGTAIQLFQRSFEIGDLKNNRYLVEREVASA
jgi:hypothetical protein